MRIKKINICLLSFLTLLSSAVLASDVTTGVIEVSTSVEPTCNIVGTDVSFSQINVNAINIAESQLNITCTMGTSYVIIVNSGSNGTISTKNMRGKLNNDLLSYNIYKDGNYSMALGEGRLGAKIYGTGDGREQVFKLNSRILANQYVTPDDYSDILTLTLQY